MRALSAASTLLFFIGCSPFASDTPTGSPEDAGTRADVATPDSGTPIARGDAYAKAVRDDGAIGYWRCRDGAGTKIAHNEVAGSPDAELADDGPNVRSGGLFPGGGECSFDGKSNNEIATAKDIPFLGNKAYALEAWVNVEVAPDGLFRHVFEDTDDGRGDAYGLFVRDGGEGPEIVAEEFVSTEHRTRRYALPPLKAWHHVVMVNGPELYIDGQLAVVEHEEDEGSTVDFDNPFSWGAKSVSEEAMNGRLTEIAIYDKTLDKDRIAAHYALGKP